MSVNIRWDTIRDDEEIQGQVREFLNEKLAAISFPSFVRNVSVESIDLGKQPPQIEIVQISDPLEEFYDEGDEFEDDETSTEGETTVDSIGESVAESVSSLPSYESAIRRKPDVNNLFGFQQTIPRVHTHWGAGNLFSSAPRWGISEPRTTTLDSPGSPSGAHAERVEGLGINTNFSPSNIPTSSTTINSPSGRESPTRIAASFLANGSFPSLVHPGPGQAIFPSPSPFLSPSSPTHQNASTSRRIHSDVSKHSLVNEQRSSRRRFDFQIELSLFYQGDMKIELSAELNLNFPSPGFVSLPLQITASSICFGSSAFVAVTSTDSRSPKVHFSLVSPLAGNHILQDMKLESRIGAGEDRNLRNVEEVESFLKLEVRRIIEEELVFPNIWTFILNGLR